MRNIYSKITVCFAVVCLIFPFISVKVSAEVNMDESVIEKYYEIQQKIIELAKSSSSTNISASGAESSNFHEVYGGCYINEAGRLVVGMKKSENTPFNIDDSVYADKPELIDLVNNHTIIIKEVAFSYTELNRVMDELNSYVVNNSHDNFNLFWLSDIDNRIVVELNEMSDRSIKEFKESVNDSDAIIFKQIKDKPVRTTNLQPGSKITTSSGSGLSLGYRVKLNGTIGILTAGHGTGIYEEIMKDGSVFGRVTTRRNYGSVDAAFIRIDNSNFIPSNLLNNTSDILSTKVSDPGVGTVINKRGAKTGHTSGKIVSTNVTLSYSDTTYTNLSSARMGADKGDSGGIVYSYIGSTGERPTVGILHGKSDDLMIYSKASVINETLGLTRY